MKLKDVDLNKYDAVHVAGAHGQAGEAGPGAVRGQRRVCEFVAGERSVRMLTPR